MNKQSPWIAITGMVWIFAVLITFFANNPNYFLGKLVVMSRFLSGGL